ncbi:unnamed protein product [Aspergillus oryzae var. brunneus]|uniref:Unnamed protein product n=1 Tax=Aspergillus oryzae var. brunneus TaxID=332754 RepID=A0ABQ6KNL3_ASPOZ|nr:unnamed protein product [Aspergillus oryzae var. brunneus]
MKPPSGLVLTFYGIANTNDTNRPDAATGSSLSVAVNAVISMARNLLFLPAFLYGDLASRIYGTICDLIDQGSYDKMLESIDDIIIDCKTLESSIDTVVTQGPALQSQPGPSDDLATGQSHEWLMKQHAANYLGACLFQVYQGTVELLSQTLKANSSKYSSMGTRPEAVMAVGINFLFRPCAREPAWCCEPGLLRIGYEAGIMQAVGR